MNTAGVTGTAEAGDNFGLTVAVGPITWVGEGAEDIVVGVPGDRVGAVPAAGAVQVFLGHPTGPSATGDEERLLSQDTPGMLGAAETGDKFGASLAIVNMGGSICCAFPLIGAPGETLKGVPHAGAIHVIGNVFGPP
ncbi:hypothetical protein ABZV93_24935 [Actinopolymorpha sp. NPDC004070]|uniref:hypothetical protein n=1 Tax=Actinopolymorpha sp. NPDC004070 TaxID=3154548 RepID=UPI0033AA1AD7